MLANGGVILVHNFRSNKYILIMEERGFKGNGLGKNNFGMRRPNFNNYNENRAVI